LSVDSSILGTVLPSEGELSEGCLRSHWAISVYWKAERLLEEAGCCDCSSWQLLITYGRHRLKSRAKLRLSVSARRTSGFWENKVFICILASFRYFTFRSAIGSFWKHGMDPISPYKNNL